MKRFLQASLAGYDLSLAATFKASEELLEKVADPLYIAREAAVEARLSTVGMVYDPRFKFTVKNVPQVIHIGLKAAGDKRSLEEVQEIVFEAGFIASREVATAYIALIVTPDSQEAEKASQDSDEGDGSPGE